MKIATILCDQHGSFFVSPHRYYSATDAFRFSREGWRWIGSPGWYGTEENKAIYERLDALFDLSRWHPGEWATVEGDGHDAPLPL